MGAGMEWLVCLDEYQKLVNRMNTPRVVLHRMFLADNDCELAMSADTPASPPPSVSYQRWVDRGYSTVSVQCGDRPKLLFDVVCTLTDMDYVVFHGTIDTDGDRAYQEFYIMGF